MPSYGSPTAGSGVVTGQSFDATTGRLTAILAGTGNIVENFFYKYDVLGNMLTRADASENLTETFTPVFTGAGYTTPSTASPPRR